MRNLREIPLEEAINKILSNDDHNLYFELPNKTDIMEFTSSDFSNVGKQGPFSQMCKAHWYIMEQEDLEEKSEKELSYRLDN